MTSNAPPKAGHFHGHRTAGSPSGLSLLPALKPCRCSEGDSHGNAGTDENNSEFNRHDNLRAGTTVQIILNNWGITLSALICPASPSPDPLSMIQIPESRRQMYVDLAEASSQRSINLTPGVSRNLFLHDLDDARARHLQSLPTPKPLAIDLRRVATVRSWGWKPA